MLEHSHIEDNDLRRKIGQNEICFGGNKKLKIYGTLQCRSGKRMKRENRIFFASKEEAVKYSYRPCGHCMKIEYRKWTCSVIQ